MDAGRPPRSVRPGRLSQHQTQSRPSAPSYPEQQRPGLQSQGSRANVAFQNTERGDRQETLDAQRQRNMPSPYQNQLSPTFDPENTEYFDSTKVGRKKSLVRPDRERIEPGHRQWHYRAHAAQALEGNERVDLLPSTTGNLPQGLRRGRSILARDQDVQESGLAIFKKSATLRRKRARPSESSLPSVAMAEKENRGCWKGPGPGGPWMMYCYIITIWVPSFVLQACGIRTPEQQRAWREKIGLLSIILLLMAGVGFLTFGFTQAVCGKPPNRYEGGSIENGSVIIHGYDYDLTKFNHPAAGPFNGTTNPLLTGGYNVAGNDISFMFQITNQNCLGYITKASGSAITGNGNNLDWYFPCNVIPQQGNPGPNTTNYDSPTFCHVASQSRGMLRAMQPLGQVYYTWDDVRNPQRNLAVFESNVLDLSLLGWLLRAEVNYPSLFDDMKFANGTYDGKDLSMLLSRTNQLKLGRCLQDIITIGFIDTTTIGCVASDIVLYLSLVFIIGVVAIRFFMAVLFAWFFSWKLGNFRRESYEQRMQRSAEIENWSNDIHLPAPSEYRPNVTKSGVSKNGKTLGSKFLPKQSRFTPSENVLKSRPTTTYGMLDSSSGSNWKRSTYAPSAKVSLKGTPPDSPNYRYSRSVMSLVERNAFSDNPCPFPLHNVVPQPPPEYDPFKFPLAHTICLVTAYSESVEGLRTTLDSLATTDYPNSHKLILVIADGMVKGAGNNMTTPDIVLSMMKDLVVPEQEVEPHSYVAIADGHKRHNMAKVFAGFYDYSDATIERSKQQRVPMVLVAKVGNPHEATEAKPGNRGKRDSQIVLMAFLQKVMFDERMTTFEYEFFNSIWRATGVSPDRYELVLCVDADTKVFPDSLTRMVSCMVHDEEIMGLCGETKIANKSQSFVTMMQVFEYYISHHMTKAFESMFGGVTCLPGCFSMYRIKAPKGDSGYWVPILANPDIVEHYSENVVDTLHKKNLLLLGEDRYLTTLMLKTFPKRKNMFCPHAVCKTVVPDTFHVLLSQRRRWINSTIHNLAELLLVRDLCGTFCFSMQFVVGMELAGTLVLPAAISFTFYLIIASVIPGHTNTTIPLVLLAIILGLPGLLIVVTSRKVAYVGWMLVYLLSLPIWNGILPAYAFWHFDDFSWGQTRKVSGDKGGVHGDKEGEFDSSHIVMKRWAEFERERRWKNGTQSRDSIYKNEGNRYSMASNSDATYQPATLEGSTIESGYISSGQRSRYDSNAVLMLPAPLSANKHLMTSTSTVGASRTSDENYLSDTASNSNQRLLPDQYSDSHESVSPASQHRYLSPSTQYSELPIPRGRNTPSTPQTYLQGVDPFRSPGSPMSYDTDPWSPDGSDEGNRYGATRGGGVQLSDAGPVGAGSEGVRRVGRQSRRPPSQTPQNRYSRNSGAYSLPPGAAAPQPYPFGGGGSAY
ncbi:glycosyltransferase family 2 protein [Amanita muscaria]